MGDFTLSEIISYYQRSDVLSVMYYQTVHWPSKMRFFGKSESLQPSSPEDLGRKIVQFILKLTSGMRMDEKLPEYPTFEVKADRDGLVDQRYDFITEDDPESWREAFERMKLVLDVLDTFGIYYQIQFSGCRSLHLRIPAEAFPRYFQGKPIADYQIVERDRTGHQWVYNPLHSAISHYLPPSGHSPFSLRMTYTTHPMTGFVALPLWRDELDVFRPWMASIHTVKVDQNWFAIPEDASTRTSDFLREVLVHSSKEKHQAWRERESLIRPPAPAHTVRATHLEVIP